MSAAYYTVVYRIDGSSVAHERWWRECVMPYRDKDGAPISVAAIGAFDAIDECDRLREERDQGSFY